MVTNDPCAPTLTWARRRQGEHEVRGGENPFILWCFTFTSYHAREDEVPWCSAFACAAVEVGARMRSCRSAAAADWLSSPYMHYLIKPRPGCICVIRSRAASANKATGSASGNHVALWLDETATGITLFGGNQNDSVKESTFSKSSYLVLGYREPVTPLAPGEVREDWKQAA